MCAIALAIILFCALTIVVRFLTRQIIVERMGITNAFTNLVLFDVEVLDVAPDINNINVEIDWEALYPFSSLIPSQHQIEQNRFHKYESKIDSIEGKVDTYATDFLVAYNKLVDTAKRYEQFIRWNYVSYAEYNGVVKLDDGYLTSYVERKDVAETADSTIELARFCEDNGIGFLYVMEPHKVCRYDSVSGTSDFANQNADAFLSRLQSAGVNTLDIRTFIHEENLPHHELFYRTDHHWKAETGLWASRHILQALIDNYEYTIDLSVLNDDQIRSVVYPAWFLGSQGKKIRLEQTTPDDFTLLYPIYQTSIHYEVPRKEIDADGDFSITYDMGQVEEKDYYGKNPYAAYIYADQPLERIENNLLGDNGHVLIIHKSFCNCVVPFLSMGVKYVDSLDLRHFTGSVQNYIATEKPDTVIVMYNSSEVGRSIDWSSHTDVFDFR